MRLRDARRPSGSTANGMSIGAFAARPTSAVMLRRRRATSIIATIEQTKLPAMAAVPTHPASGLPMPLAPEHQHHERRQRQQRRDQKQ